MKIGIVGMGWVGSSIASCLLQTGAARELVVCDMKHSLAEGEAMDLAHGAAFYPTSSVRAGQVAELQDADAVVVAAGRGSRPGETRLDLLRDNARIVSEICSQLKSLRGLLLVVTNPVDVLTFVATQASGLPAERVLGTGTMLDTARLRQVLGRELRVEPRSIHAQVIGEHGDSEVVLWSGVQLGGTRLRDWPGWQPEREVAIATEVRRAAYEIISRKGATNHAIGLTTAALLKWALRGERRILTVSRVQAGAVGVHGVAVSLPCIVGSDGCSQVIEPDMSDAERSAFERSVLVLRENQRSLTSG
jgi:L-lactate dehydrogenase